MREQIWNRDSRLSRALAIIVAMVLVMGLTPSGLAHAASAGGESDDSYQAGSIREIAVQAADDAPENAVAQVAVGDTVTYYESLDAALAAATNGSTVTLLSHATGDFRVTASIALDLNGCFVKNETESYTIQVLNGASLTLFDASAGQLGSVENSNAVEKHASAVWVREGSVTIASGAYSSLAYGLRVAAGSSANVQGGALSGTVGVFVEGVSSEAGASEPGTLTMTGGDAKGSLYGLNNEGSANVQGGTFSTTASFDTAGIKNSGSIDIKGGSITGAPFGFINAGTATMSGGAISGLFGVSNHANPGQETPAALTVKGGTISGQSVGVYGYDGQVNIEGGTVSIEGNSGNVISQAINARDAAIYITGGTVSNLTEGDSAKLLVRQTDAGRTGSIAVSGGSFSETVTDEFLAEGCVSVKSTEPRLFEVIEGVAVARVNGANYVSLQAAVNAAGEGETVELLADTVEDIEAIKNLTIDLCGHTLKATGKSAYDAGQGYYAIALRVANGAITVKNGNIVCRAAEAAEGADSANQVNANAVWVEGNGASVELGADVTVTSGETALFVRGGGSCTVKGAQIVGEGAYSGVGIYGSGSSVAFESGSVTASNTNTFALAAGAELSITDGTVVAASGAPTVYATDGCKVTISGGRYSSSVNPDHCAEGLVPSGAIDDSAAPYGVMPKTDAVARIGSTYFTSLKAAVADVPAGSVNSTTIQLLADFELSDTVEIAAGKNIALDLAGHKITTAENTTGRHYYAIDNSGIFTLEDSVGHGSITARGIENLSGGVMTINSGEIVACDANGGAAIWNEGALTVNGGTLLATHVGSAYDEYGPGCLNNSGTATLNGGSFTSANKRTYAVISTGSIVVNNADVFGTHGGLAVDEGTATLNGGKFGSSEYYGLYVSNDSTGVTPGQAQVTVNDGEFTGKNYSVFIGSDINDDVDSIIDVKDGTFLKPINVQANVVDGSGIHVSGGNFSAPVPENYCADGYVPTGKVGTNAEAPYSVVTEDEAVAAIGKARYSTVAAAVADAEDGDEIVLLMVASEAGFRVAVPVTINLNGKTLEIAGSDAIAIASNVTFENGTITSEIDDVLTVESGALTLGEDLAIDAEGSALLVKTGATATVAGASIASASETKTGVFVGADATLNLNAGTIEAVSQPAITSQGTFNIADGNVATASSWAVGIGGAASEANIAGGTISNKGNALAGYAVYAYDSGTAKITGGTLIGASDAVDSAAVACAEGASVLAQGGWFSAPVSRELCADGYAPTGKIGTDEAAPYTVGTAYGLDLKAYYGTLVASEDSGVEGAELTLTATPDGLDTTDGADDCMLIKLVVNGKDESAYVTADEGGTYTYTYTIGNEPGTVVAYFAPTAFQKAAQQAKELSDSVTGDPASLTWKDLADMAASSAAAGGLTLDQGKLDPDGVIANYCNELLESAGSSLDKITELDMSDKPLDDGVDPSVLSVFENLKSLDLSGTDVSDLSGIAGLDKLEKLDVSRTNVASFDFLQDEDGVALPSLKQLIAHDLELRSVEELHDIATSDGFEAAGTTWDLAGSCVHDPDRLVPAIAEALGQGFSKPLVFVEGATALYAGNDSIQVNYGASSIPVSGAPRPQHADVVESSWSSSDESVAAVDEDGNVTFGNVGEATITYEVEGIEDPQTERATSARAIVSVRVLPVAPTVTAPTARILTFNGQEQALVNAGLASGGQVVYRTNSSDEWQSDVPTATDAGTYTVYYRVEGDANHTDTSESSVTVAIGQASAVTASPTANTLVYNGSAQDLVTAPSVRGGSMKYSLDPLDETSWSADVPTGTNAGDYVVHYRFDADSNHSGSASGQVNVSIAAAQSGVSTEPMAASGLTYDGSDHPLVTGGAATGGTLEYTTTPDDDDSWTSAVPSASDAGEYAVYYRVKADANHNGFNGEEPIIATVLKANVTVTANDASKVVGEAEPTLTATVSGVAAGDDVSAIRYTLSRSAGETAGTYAISATGDADQGNYSVRFVNGTFTINEAAPSPGGSDDQGDGNDTSGSGGAAGGDVDSGGSSNSGANSGAGANAGGNRSATTNAGVTAGGTAGTTAGGTAGITTAAAAAANAAMGATGAAGAATGANAATAANAAGAATGTNATAGTTQNIANDATPLSRDAGDESIADDANALSSGTDTAAGSASFSMFDLFAALATLVLGGAMSVRAALKRRNEGEAGAGNVLGLAGLAPAAAAVVALLVTQDFSQVPVAFDGWAPLFGGLFAAQVALLAAGLAAGRSKGQSDMSYE